MTYATDGQFKCDENTDISYSRERVLFFRCAEELQGRAANVLDGRAGLIIIRACAVDLVEL